MDLKITTLVITYDNDVILQVSDNIDVNIEHNRLNLDVVEAVLYQAQ